MVLEKTLESPLDCREIKPVNCKGNQSWIFIGRTDGEAEDPKLWPPDAKSLLIGKDPDARDDWRQEEKGTTEDDWIDWMDCIGWMVSLIQWIWIWAISGSWWRTAKPGVLQSMGSPRIRHDWVNCRTTTNSCFEIYLSVLSKIKVTWPRKLCS